MPICYPLLNCRVEPTTCVGSCSGASGISLQGEREGYVVNVTLGPPYAGRCLFCGSRKELTDEHVFAKAIRIRMPKVTTVRTVEGSQLLNASSALNVVLKRAVCGTCNRGWMGNLERSFVGALGDQLSTPAQRHLDPIRQERVATWAIKVALLLGLYTSTRGSDSSSFVPNSNLRWLWHHQAAPSPPPNAQVWLGTLSNPGPQLAHFQPSWFAMNDGVPLAYFVTFSLGYIVFQVYGSEVLSPKDPGAQPKLPALNPPPALRQTITEIWPGSGHDAVWPTMRPAVAAQLETLEGWPETFLEALPGRMPGLST